MEKIPRSMRTALALAWRQAGQPDNSVIADGLPPVESGKRRKTGLSNEEQLGIEDEEEGDEEEGEEEG